MPEPLLSITQRIAHELETVRVYERAEAHIAGTCQCDADILSEECADALNLACAQAQAEVLDVLARSRVDLERHIERLELEQRIEVLERHFGVVPPCDPPCIHRAGHVGPCETEDRESLEAVVTDGGRIDTQAPFDEDDIPF